MNDIQIDANAVIDNLATQVGALTKEKAQLVVYVNQLVQEVEKLQGELADKSTKKASK